MLNHLNHQPASAALAQASQSSSTPRVKILHVLPWITSGGVERRRLQLVCGLDPARFEQRVLCKERAEPLASMMEQGGALISQVEGRWSISDVEALASALRIVEDYQPDIIHGAVFEGVVFASLLGYLARVPHIVVEETGATPTRSWRGDLLMAASCALAHRCVAVSPYVGRYLRARSHIGPEKLRVITNGVRFPRQVSSQERADVRAALGLTPEQLVIGCVGRVFNEHKRFSDVIDALAKLSRPDAALIIVGDGPDLNMLRRRAASLNLADRVKLVGRQADIAPYLGAMDIFVLSSSYEAFGLVIPEAMSAALPVVATRVDAVPDIVEEGVTGLLVPPRDPAALATALDELAASPERRLQMGLAGQQRAHDYFDESRYVRDVDAFYRELLS